jgi:hypothetical protein
MELSGDQDGIALLKGMHHENPTYLKFLIQEARTVFEHQVDFKSKDGANKYRLAFDPPTGVFTVSKL